MSVLHLEADVKLPHDSLVVIAVHCCTAHIPTFKFSLLEFFGLKFLITKAIIIPPSTFKVKKFLSKV